MSGPTPTGPLPEGFAADLVRVLAPGEADAAAAVLAEAARLDDPDLADFLERFARRVAALPEPVTAAELRDLLPPRRRS